MTSPPASIRWIDDGEKYALVALSVKVEGDIPTGAITPNLRVLTETTFPTSSLWRGWLGSNLRRKAYCFASGEINIW
jgi:hypothetical protein